MEKNPQTPRGYLESLQEPSLLYQLLPKPPPTGRSLLKDPRFLCNIFGGSFPKFLLHDFWRLLLLWGNANASPSACERERMSLFKFSSSRFAAAAAVRPLACRLPARQQGSQARRACSKGVSALGRGTRSGRGKESAKPYWGSPLSLHRREPTILPFL